MEENKITTIEDFEKELKAIDPRLTIVPNPNRPGLSNIKIDGSDICPIPSEYIKENPDPAYIYTFPNDMQARHKSKTEALSMVHSVLQNLSNPEYADAFHGKGDFENDEDNKPELATEPLSDEQKKEIEG